MSADERKGCLGLPRRVLDDRRLSGDAVRAFLVLMDCERAGALVTIGDEALGKRLGNQSHKRYRYDSPEYARKVIRELIDGQHIEPLPENGSGRKPTYRILYDVKMAAMPHHQPTAQERQAHSANLPLESPQPTAPNTQTYRSRTATYKESTSTFPTRPSAHARDGEEKKENDDGDSISPPSPTTTVITPSMTCVGADELSLEERAANVRRLRDMAAGGLRRMPRDGEPSASREGLPRMVAFGQDAETAETQHVKDAP